MPQPNQIEIGLILRDQATAGMEQFAATTQNVTRQVGQLGPQVRQVGDEIRRSSEKVEDDFSRAGAAATGMGRNVQAVASAGRFLAVTAVNELSPALGRSGAQLASLASLAAFTGTAIGALTVVGVGGLVVGLKLLFESTRKAKEELEEFNKVLAQGEEKALFALRAQIFQEEARLRETIDDLQERIAGLLAGPTDEASGIAAAQAARRLEQAKARQRLLLDRVGELVLEIGKAQLATLGEEEAKADAEEAEKRKERRRKFQEDEDKARAEAELDAMEAAKEARLRFQQQEANEAAREELRAIAEDEAREAAATAKALGQAEDALKKRADLEAQFRRLGLGELEAFANAEATIRRREQEQDLALLRETLDGERALMLERLDLMARHGRDSGLQFAAGIQLGLIEAEKALGTFGQNAAAIVAGTASAMARSFDDLFFNVLTGQLRKLEDIAKQVALGIVREFTGAAGRLATRNLLGQLGVR